LPNQSECLLGVGVGTGDVIAETVLEVG